MSAELTSTVSPMSAEREKVYLKIVYAKFWAQILCCMALVGVSGYQVVINGDVKWLGGVTTALGVLTRSPSSDLEDSRN